MNQQGRVRVQLLNEDGAPRHPDTPTSTVFILPIIACDYRNKKYRKTVAGTAVMLYVAALIPKLKSRLGGGMTPAAASAAPQTTKPSGKKTKRK